jgi:hypothetical protein
LGSGLVSGLGSGLLSGLGSDLGAAPVPVAWVIVLEMFDVWTSPADFGAAGRASLGGGAAGVGRCTEADFSAGTAGVFCDPLATISREPPAAACSGAGAGRS